jgi:Cu-Zn family superoxide dismutase
MMISAHVEGTMDRNRAILLLGGCAWAWLAATSASAQTATAAISPTAGNNAKGTVTFARRGEKVTVSAQLSGVPPGKHGFHIHEKGDCSAPDATSAGGHFNPTGKPHGAPGTPEHHAGDMPMLEADASGNARLSAELSRLTLGDGGADIVGRSVVVHKDPDDYRSQPAGDSGPRIGCGVIHAS